MNKEIHRQSLDAALKEVIELCKEREKVEEQLNKLHDRIDELTSAIAGLAPLCGIDPEKEYPYLFLDEVETEIGLTGAIRKIIFKKPYESMPAIKVRDRLIESGFDLDKYTNAMASIHTILKRLVKSGEAIDENIEGRTFYYANFARAYARKKKKQQ